MFSRNRLKWVLAGCFLTFAIVFFLQAVTNHPLPIREAFFVLQTGSAVGAIAIGLLLVATI